MYYNTCPYCEAHLDPGERCDCQDDLKQKKQTGRRHLADLLNHKKQLTTKTLYNVGKEKSNECKN